MVARQLKEGGDLSRFDITPADGAPSSSKVKRSRVRVGAASDLDVGGGQGTTNEAGDDDGRVRDT